MFRRLFLSLFCVLLFFPFQGESKIFQNSYIRFQMPERWTCKLQAKAYICHYGFSSSCKARSGKNKKWCQREIKKSREAVIVLSARPKSSLDSLETFAQYFGQPKRLRASQGASSQSQVVHGKRVSIQGLEWVDSMQLGSEIPHYYTRYLATLNGDVAVLISFSAHKRFYTNYSSQFFKGIKSLKVITSRVSAVKEKERGDRVFSRPIDLPGEFLGEKAPGRVSEPFSFSDLLFGLAFIMALLGLYLWFKRLNS